jgi:hypothetical protein
MTIISPARFIIRPKAVQGEMIDLDSTLRHGDAFRFPAGPGEVFTKPGLPGQSQNIAVIPIRLTTVSIILASCPCRSYEQHQEKHLRDKKKTHNHLLTKGCFDEKILLKSSRL